MLSSLRHLYAAEADGIGRALLLAFAPTVHSTETVPDEWARRTREPPAAAPDGETALADRPARDITLASRHPERKSVPRADAFYCSGRTLPMRGG
jgi:hypothetical protein